jgi:hypothetical protein
VSWIASQSECSDGIEELCNIFARSTWACLERCDVRTVVGMGHSSWPRVGQVIRDCSTWWSNQVWYSSHVRGISGGVVLISLGDGSSGVVFWNLDVPGGPFLILY